MIQFRAPGRVNLIGEHVDYVGGLVLPAALDRGVTVTGSAAADGVVRLESGTFPGRADVVIDKAAAADQDGWVRYVAAVVAELSAAGFDVVGFEGTVDSDLPAGSGLSSSAALEVAVAGALVAASGGELVGLELALLGQSAEHRAVGVPCGIMDQAASVLGQAGHAVLLDCGSLEHRAVLLPEGIALVIIDSGVRRRLEDSAYAERRAEIEAALALLPAGAARDDPESTLALAERVGIAGTPLRRLRHVVTENARVTAVVAALEHPGGTDVVELGRLFEEGHASLRDDFEVSVPELDLLVELAREEGAIAARMTGGGFGGAIIALTPVDQAEALAAIVGGRYAATSGLTPTALVGHAGPGASRIA